MSDPLPALESDPPSFAEICSLRDYLDHVIPPKRDTFRNLLIATWNLKEFGSLNDKWVTSRTDKPMRDKRALWAITEIISRFDIVAVQEVEGDLKALRTMLKTLGDGWHFLMTDKNAGHSGGGERLAFIFDARRVMLSGIACELVMSEEHRKSVATADEEQADLLRQFARTPYAVGFRAGSETIILVTLHICYGKDLHHRETELKAIADWIGDWTKETTEFEQNFIALGDFNIDRKDSPLYQALVGKGLQIAPCLENVPRSIFNDEINSQDRYYDQIAWFADGEKRRLPLAYIKGGYVNFLKHLYKDISLDPAAIQYRISDHYPLWVEFGCRSEETIKRAQEERKGRRGSGNQAEQTEAPLAVAAPHRSAN